MPLSRTLPESSSLHASSHHVVSFSFMYRPRSDQFAPRYLIHVVNITRKDQIQARTSIPSTPSVSRLVPCLIHLEGFVQPSTFMQSSSSFYLRRPSTESYNLICFVPDRASAHVQRNADDTVEKDFLTLCQINPAVPTTAQI